MKRNIPSFTVEVRRQPRRASNPSANGRLFDTAPIRTAFDRDTQRAADAVFEAKAPEQPLPDSAPSTPKGRILPSLVVDDASMRSFREDDPEQLDESPRGPPKRRSARFQKTAKPSKPRRISASPTAETAPLAPPAEAIDLRGDLQGELDSLIEASPGSLMNNSQSAGSARCACAISSFMLFSSPIR